jgi:hypothetical protein
MGARAYVVESVRRRDLMKMPNTLFAVLLGIIAVVGLVMAARDWGKGAPGRSRAIGWLVAAIGAGIQVANLLTDYNWMIGAVATLGLFVGLWMGLPNQRGLSQPADQIRK